MRSNRQSAIDNSNPISSNLHVLYTHLTSLIKRSGFQRVGAATAGYRGPEMAGLTANQP